MPRVRTKRTRFPAGWSIIEATLDELEERMKECVADDNDGQRKNEALWPIFRIHHQRSRYIYEMFYKRKEITRELYEFCLREGYADANLIAKWKRSGYERLCCLRCVQPKDHNFGTVCICRVPKAKLDEGKVVECTHCGCRGCCSGD